MMTEERQLTKADTKELARLVGKYGRASIVAAAKRVRTPGPGRPRTSGKWEEVEWVEQRAAEIRESGQKYGAFHQAVSERFLQSVPREEQTAENLKKYEKKIKNFRDEWQRIQRIKNARKAAL
jgi:hypothetical protein